MAYIGNAPADRFTSIPTVQQFNGDGSTTAFTLSRPVGTDQDLLVSVDGVIQDTAAYAVSNGTTLTFSAAPSTGTANIFVNYLGVTIGSVVHPASSALAATTGTFSDAVGIGETSPLGKLHVKSGDSAASSVNGNANELVVENSDYSGITILGENETSIMFGDNEDPDVGRIEYFHSTNSMSFRTNASDAMLIDGNGHVTMPKQPAFLVNPASNQNNIATGTQVTVVFGTEVYDVGSNFASNTFTAPVTGKYQLNFQLTLLNVDSASLYYEAKLVTSNRTYNFIIDPDFGQDAGYWSISGAMLADMDANDTVILNVVHHSGTAQTDIQTATFFSGYLAC